jgi:PAS domain S-box-containing protein
MSQQDESRGASRLVGTHPRPGSIPPSAYSTMMPLAGMYAGYYPMHPETAHPAMLPYSWAVPPGEAPPLAASSRVLSPPAPVEQPLPERDNELVSLLEIGGMGSRIRTIISNAEREAAARIRGAEPEEGERLAHWLPGAAQACVADDADPPPESAAKKAKPATDRASRRRELNRVNAKKSRMRKKFFMEALIGEISKLDRENEALRATMAGPDLPTSRPTRSKSHGPLSVSDATESTASARRSLPPPEPKQVSLLSRIVASADLQPQMRDALVATGPDEDLVRLLVSGSQSFCVVDPSVPDFPLAYVSPAFERLTGYSASEIVGRNCRFLQGPGTDMAAARALGAAVRAGRDCTQVLLNYRKDGAPFWNMVQVTPLVDSAGTVRSLLGTQTCVSRPLPTLERVVSSEPARADARHSAPPGTKARNALSDADAALVISSISQVGGEPSRRDKRPRDE